MHEPPPGCRRVQWNAGSFGPILRVPVPLVEGDFLLYDKANGYGH